LFAGHSSNQRWTRHVFGFLANGLRHCLSLLHTI
jgi:hypothetical protein